MLALALALLITPSQKESPKQVTLLPEDKQLTLTGKIHLLHGYGPPGWGEDPKHDSRITYWVIELPAPINTPCTPEDPKAGDSDCQPTKRLRLVIEYDPNLLAEAKASRNQTATVTGTLHRQDTVGEMTPIFMMDVIAIKPQ